MRLTDDLKRIWLRIETAITGATPAGTNTIGKVDVTSISIPATLVHGQKTIATAGTELALAGDNTLTIGVTVKALSTNTGLMYVGLNPVTSSTGFELAAGEQIFIPITNTNLIFVDCSVNGESVSFLAG